ncbi:MAG: hypothetical protein JOZ40_03275 [Methylobacteriaceae bacterium]|nr:hypothetical protein [Methylobacteriaceae bacterium]
MRKNAFSFAALGAMLALALSLAAANAQNARSWVAGNGNDAGPCTKAQPCATFARALSQTNAGGEINCVDRGEFSGGVGLTIAKSITIDCNSAQGRFSPASPQPVAILVSAASTDVVVLRGLDIDGNGISALGIDLTGGAALHIEKCVIRNFAAGGLPAGILFSPLTNSVAELLISDTRVTDNGTGTPGGAGILVRPAIASGVTKAILTRVEVRNNFFGIKADGTQAIGGVINLTVRDSVSTGNAANGIVGTGSANGAAIVMMIDRSTSSHNVAGFGVIADGPKTTIRLGGSSIAGNINGVGASNGGVLQSYGTNEISGNSNDGLAALTPIGGLTASGPIDVTADQTVIENVHVSSTSGSCITIERGVSGTVIRNSEIGPCMGNGVEGTRINGLSIFDSYIHPENPVNSGNNCCDSRDGLFLMDSSNIDVEGNVIAFGESNIEVDGLTGTNVFKGNFLLNPTGGSPRGQNFQAWSGSNSNSGITFSFNYTLTSQDPKYPYPGNPEDNVNFGHTSNSSATDNYIVGGWSPSGCGLISDTSTDTLSFLRNRIYETGQCGIGVASGTTITVDSNKIFNDNPVPNGGNTGIYVANYGGGQCGNITVTNNTSYAQTSFWANGDCGSIPDPGNNILDAAAFAVLNPFLITNPPPLIPPMPKNCAAASPWTTQTSVAGCGRPLLSAKAR